MGELKGFGKSTHAKNLEAMKAVYGFPNKHRVRKAETKPRKPYDRAEDRLRPLVIKCLRDKGFLVWRVEPYGRGSFGLPDLWAINRRMYKAYWIELKTYIGKQSTEQLEFQTLCGVCNVNYIIIKSVEEASAL